jgi:hypothetical protein
MVGVCSDGCAIFRPVDVIGLTIRLDICINLDTFINALGLTAV